MEESGNRKERGQNQSRLSKLSAARETAETIARFGFALVGWCYVVGLMILNLHLGQYGVVNLNFLQVEYVLAGALWTGLVGYTYAFFYYAIWAVRSTYEEWKGEGRRLGLALKTGLMIIGLPGFLFYAVTLLSGNELGLITLLFATESALPTLAVLGILAGTAVMFPLLSEDIQSLLQSVTNGQASAGRDATRRRAIFFLPFYRIIALLPLLTLYALYAYPRFLPAWGGGKKQVVEFIAKSGHTSTFASMGLRVGSENRKVEPLEVIFESSDFFTVAPTKDMNPEGRLKAIRINKDLIDAAIYLGKK